MEIQIFENEQFGQLRGMTIEGEPWFVGKDVAQVLGYKNTRDALGKHVDTEDKTTVAFCDTGSNYKTQATFINESGVYVLCVSRLVPLGREFKRWVTAEVLPQIRRTGGYIPIRQEDDEKTILCKAVEILRRETRPIQRWVEQGLFDTSVTLVQTHHGTQERCTTKVTGKGQEYFVAGFLSGRFSIE